MSDESKMDRRNFLKSTAWGIALGNFSGILPAWAYRADQGNLGLPILSGTRFYLSIGTSPVSIDGRSSQAVGVNGTVPAPLIRFREGEKVKIRVQNKLKVDSSIHWHGLLVPFQMDGVPGVTFPGIKPGETFDYEFAVPQNGTYWYHSHSGLQEQSGHYGPLIIDPAGKDPVHYDREYVLVLGDWTFSDPHRIFSKLKKNAESLNFNQRTLRDFIVDTSNGGVARAIDDRAMWGAMRMSPRDIADVTGETYTYIINGHSTADNWNGIFRLGEKVRLRIINAAAMTLFNVRIPGLPMTLVQADGLNIKPMEVDEFQIGVAETYDAIIEPKESRAYAFVAESIDRSGQAVATFGPQPGMRAEQPALRTVPTLTMKDMGMHHGTETPGGAHQEHGAHRHGFHPETEMVSGLAQGPGVANVAAMPVNRLTEPGIGLEAASHRTLRYSDLRSLEPNPDQRAPEREVTVHLTSNMERYMWSFDGTKFSEVTEPIKFYEGERVRLTMINNTMMPHPIHLHGMFFDVVNGGGTHKPRKHTIVVKPGEKLSVDITADHIGDWAFHCHLLYHMHAGMMQVVSVLPRGPRQDEDDDTSQEKHGAHGHKGMHH